MAAHGPAHAGGVHVDLGALIGLQHQARGFHLLPRQPVQSLLSGRRASRLRGRGLSFEEIRHYLPGDDIRSVDWKVTARTGSPHTRVYSEERDRSVIAVVDQRVSMFFGSRVAMKSVRAAEAAALTAWRVVDQGDRIGAVLFNDEDHVLIRPRRSRRTVMRILGELERRDRALEWRPGRAPRPEALDDALEQVRRLVTHDALIVVISDAFGATPATREHLEELSAHNDVLVVLVYDALESALPDTGTLVASDGELQAEIETGDASVRDRFRTDFQTRLERATTLLRRREVPVLPIHTGAPVAEQVRRALGGARPGRRR